MNDDLVAVDLVLEQDVAGLPAGTRLRHWFPARAVAQLMNQWNKNVGQESPQKRADYPRFQERELGPGDIIKAGWAIVTLADVTDDVVLERYEVCKTCPYLKRTIPSSQEVLEHLLWLKQGKLVKFLKAGNEELLTVEGTTYCSLCGCNVTDDQKAKVNLARKVENLPATGCKHPERAKPGEQYNGKGWRR